MADKAVFNCVEDIPENKEQSYLVSCPESRTWVCKRKSQGSRNNIMSSGILSLLRQGAPRSLLVQLETEWECLAGRLKRGSCTRCRGWEQVT